MFAWDGWTGVCSLGAGLSLIALIVWLTSGRSMPDRQPGSDALENHLD
jgi:hypothetical protein